MKKVRSVKTLTFNKEEIKDGVRLQVDKKHGDIIYIPLLKFKNKDEISKSLAELAIFSAKTMEFIYIYIIRVTNDERVGLISNDERMRKVKEK